ncbi:hypothetical protein GUITHDRAFT_65858 [Guillardia theta CCMP2712]|uniref:Malic enzyme n=1 Tax=Guillardia theta (strain CCMP2712) TaxID=905079 RepID=L1JSF4_GUITC|nr:hypothetical protein GUITHDRAFT_65858 [Guillardia theta CCMP2712]EKX51367.1 hypothetical protein GUITHDRAFT_65858 [Guillardia theta CCMP2712]|eukprot:XP_005838347.1 hypothetical protein GUITHDRAFT_65858 [Guillardia theta CCMP2712]
MSTSNNKEEAQGWNLLKLPSRSASITTSKEDRERLRMRGLLPAGQVTMEAAVEALMEQIRDKSTDLERYILLHSIQDGCEKIYFAALMKYTKELMPIVYTPTVGQACLDWHRIYRHTPRGLYLSLEDIGHVKEALQNWPEKNIKVIVVTDGERILGLGDLGVNGMGIPVGKLALYTGKFPCAGIDPAYCLPVQLDVGTNNEALRNQPTYMGLRRQRERGPSYDQLVKEFIEAAKEEYGSSVLIQFEDFGNKNAFRLLETYSQNTCCFNDDIQGTAAVALAGLIASKKLTKRELEDETFLFFGAGEAGTGIAELVASYIAEKTSKSKTQAREKIWLFDSQGLITSQRAGDLAHHKKPFAHDFSGSSAPSSLAEAISLLRPTGLIGASAMPKVFNEEVCRKMGEINERPIIFSLSNPTSKAECTAQEAYTWTEGRCVYSSGSPMQGLTINGRDLIPGQGNNAFIFPGLGLAALAAGAKRIDEECLLIAARVLASNVDQASLDKGTIYPPVSKIRQVSTSIACEVANYMFDKGLATKEKPKDLGTYVQKLMFDPN